jgi:hypothetical protein
MAERKQAKRERRQAAGGEGAKGSRRQADETGEQTKAARRGARAGGKPRSRSSGRAGAAASHAPGGGNGEAIESRLARIEEAVSAQSQLSEELLAKLDEVLEEARRSAG